MLDAESGATTRDQQLKIRRVIVNVVATLSSNRRMFTRHHHRGAVLQEVTAGRWLRQQREQLSGKWQGPLGVPRGSIVICVSLGSPAGDLATELLVRMLRNESIDARHFSSTDIDAGLPPGADPDGVAIAFLVSAFPSSERDRAEPVGLQLQKMLPQANLIRLFCHGVSTPSSSSYDDPGCTVNSLGQAIDICVSWRELHKRDASSKPKSAGVVQAA
jgi:hypothetical protein